MLNWKYICKKAITLFWTENLQKMLQDKTSLRNVNTKDLKVGSTHLVWTSLPSNVADLRKGRAKCRMLTGTYLVQKDKHRFSNGRVDPICPLCGVGDEDIEHMLTRCSALHCIRKDQFTRFKELVISYIGTDAWSQTFVWFWYKIEEYNAAVNGIMLQNACSQSLENERLWIADVQAYICSHVKI